MIAKSNVPWYNHDHAMHANGFGFEFRSTHSRETYRVDVKPAHTACMGAAPRMSVTVAAAPHFDSSVYGSRRTEMFTVVVWPSELDDDPSAGHSPASSLSPTRARVSSSAAAVHRRYRGTEIQTPLNGRLLPADLFRRLTRAHRIRGRAFALSCWRTAFHMALRKHHHMI